MKFSSGTGIGGARIAFALSYMTKGLALTWAATFCQSAISGTSFTLGTFADFVTKFNTTFKHHNVTGNAISWLSTKHMQKNAKNNSHSPPLTEYIHLHFQKPRSPREHLQCQHPDQILLHRNSTPLDAPHHVYGHCSLHHRQLV